jgi:threonine synthase
MNAQRRSAWQGIIREYGRFLPLTKTMEAITLHEGNTPLVYSKKLSMETGLEVHLKCEGSQPTGSFKDRGMTLAVSKAKDAGAKAILCASTGNTSASAAAYAARAGLRCFVLLPKGAVAMGKLSQAMMCRARVLPINGNFDDALRIAREVTAQGKTALVNSLNPDRIEGQKTGAFEICDALGDAPDFHVMPVGNAGNIYAYWKGYTEYRLAKKARKLPHMHGYQAHGASPIVLGRPVKNPQTFATAIRIGNPASWLQAERVRYESGGNIDSVTDSEIRKAYEWLAGEDGLFVEPASAASVAGLLKLSKSKQFKRQKTKRKQIVVCVLTGNGLKDPESALRSIKAPRTIPASTKKVLEIIAS